MPKNVANMSERKEYQEEEKCNVCLYSCNYYKFSIKHVICDARLYNEMSYEWIIWKRKHGQTLHDEQK